jgi:hypothetical protein
MSEDLDVRSSIHQSSTQPWLRAAAPQKLFDDGYSSTDIIGTVFRVVRNTDMMEFLKLEYIKVHERETSPSFLVKSTE